MDLLAQYIINGIVLGSVYTLLALGLTLMFSIMRIVNFAHGEVYMLGAYICWEVINHLTNNYFLGIVGAIIFGAVLGYVLERLAFNPVYDKEHINMFIVSIGLVTLLQEAATLIWSGWAKSIRTPYTSVVNKWGSISITDQRLLIVGVSILMVAVLIVFFWRSWTGKAMRAAAANRLGASMVGININRMSSLAFMMGGALACLSGSLLGPLFSITPSMGAPLIGVCFVVIVLGGMGSIEGSIIAGYMLGIITSLFEGYVSSEWTYAVSFVTLILLLLFRPMGLLGRD
jgi:branched-chain amino acid transport system permease protein